MKKILAFGASSSRHSINKRLASFTANQIHASDVVLLDLNDFEMPIFSVDREKESGYPQEALEFKRHIKACDAIVISFAEHNGSYSAAFKNIFDWVSRVEKDVWNNRPMFLLSTSTGARGGQTILEHASAKFRRMTSGHVSTFSLPSFAENFHPEKGIVEEGLNKTFQDRLKEFTDALG